MSQETELLARTLRAYALKQGVDLPMTFWRGMAESLNGEVVDGIPGSRSLPDGGRYLVVPMKESVTL